MKQIEVDWELILKKPPVNRPLDSSRNLKDRIFVEIERAPKSNILQFPSKLFLGFVACFAVFFICYTIFPQVKEKVQGLQTTKLQMLPGTNDIPLYPGLQPEPTASGRYLIPKNTVDEVHKFYKEKLPSFGWTFDSEGEGTGNGPDGPIKGKVSIWYNPSQQSWLRVNLYEHPNGQREVFLENHFRDSSFMLSPAEQAVYNNFQKDLNKQQLKGLEPISVAKLYVQARLDNKNDVVYALYTDKNGYVQWTKEEDDKIPNSDRGTREQILKSFNNIEKGKLVQTSDFEGYIEYQSSEDAKSKTGFKIIRNDDGIWNVSFKPIQ
jgi:hypothetical protein